MTDFDAHRFPIGPFQPRSGFSSEERDGFIQAAWGETKDALAAPVDVSLDLLEALHSRWVFSLRSLSPEDLGRTYLHPEMGEITLETTLQLYAWHGKHHLGHVKLVAAGE